MSVAIRTGMESHEFVPTLDTMIVVDTLLLDMGPGTGLMDDAAAVKVAVRLKSKSHVSIGQDSLQLGPTYYHERLHGSSA